MANTLLTITMITREALRVLENNLVATRYITREYDPKFGVEGAKIGNVLNVRKPPRYVGRTGQALAIEDAVEEQVPITLDTQFGVDLAFSSSDLALHIDDFSERFIKPAIATVANKVDRDVLRLYRDIHHAVGTPNTVPSTLLVYLDAGVKLDDSATPMDGQRAMILSPRMQATLVDALTGLFQAANAIAEQYRKGVMGTAIGFEFAMDQNVATHTYGLQGGAGLVNGADQTGTSLITDGWTAAAATRLNRGDVFTIANVNKVNPQSRESVDDLQQFVVVSDAASDASGNMTITIDPPMVASGQRQTVDALPANNAAITVAGATIVQSRQGLALHKNAMTLACADLPMPRGVDMAARVSDPQLGLSIRMIRAYDINLDRFPCRLDILYGVKVLRPETACRVQS